MACNKQELVDTIAKKANISKKDAAIALKATEDSIVEAVSKGEKVQLVGFGSFEVRHRAARKGRNPQTGAELDIPASKAPAFKAGKAFKNAVAF